MRTFSTEFKTDYPNYRFGYCNFAERENNENPTPIYASGFLPYSANLNEKRELFYQARSLRIDLNNLGFSKSRRYEQRKFEALNPSLHFHPIETIDANLLQSIKCQSLQWIKQRFDPPYVNEARFDYLIAHPLLNTLATVSLNDSPIAHLLICQHPRCLHYWFAFYNAEAFPQISLGKVIMGHFIQWAAQTQTPYIYLGTAYKPQSAYKYQGITGFEFFDGSGWNRSKEELKERHQTDLNQIA